MYKTFCQCLILTKMYVLQYQPGDFSQSSFETTKKIIIISKRIINISK